MEYAAELNVWSKRKIQVKVLLSASGGMLVPCTEMRKIVRRAAQNGNQECCVFVNVKFDITIKHPCVNWSGYLDICIVDWLGVRSINRTYEYRGGINKHEMIGLLREWVQIKKRIAD